jgi:hypothetical protein
MMMDKPEELSIEEMGKHTLNVGLRAASLVRIILGRN